MRRTSVKFAICLVVIAGVASGAYELGRRRGLSMKNGCANNLRILHAAISCAAMEHGLVDGDIMDPEMFLSYVKDNAFPPCLRSGTYVNFIVGEVPICTWHGDLLGPAKGCGDK